MPRNSTEAFGTRTYRTPGGWTVPSVTTILGVLDKPWMGPWAAKLAAQEAVDSVADWAHWSYTAESIYVPNPDDAIRAIKGAPFRRRDDAAEHGTDVHTYLEERVKGYESPEDRSPSEKAIDDFLDLYRPNVIASERQVCTEPTESDPHGWAGSFDLLADIYGETYLIDLKTSKAIDHKWSLQLAGYALAEWMFTDDKREHWPADVEQAAILWVPSDRPEQWQLLARPLNMADFAAWRRVLDLYHYLAEAKADHGFRLVLPQTEEAA